MTFDEIGILALGALLLYEAVRFPLRIRRRRRERAAARRRAIAEYRRTVPFSVRLGLPAEGYIGMSNDQIDDFMRPEDMSKVKAELEELEKAGDFAREQEENALRSRLLRAGQMPHATVAAAPRPPSDELTEDEQAILAMTDARAARR